MNYKKKVTKKTKGSSTGGVLGNVVGGVLGQFLQGYSTNLLGAQGGASVTKKVITKKK